VNNLEKERTKRELYRIRWDHTRSFNALIDKNEVEKLMMEEVKINMRGYNEEVERDEIVGRSKICEIPFKTLVSDALCTLLREFPLKKSKKEDGIAIWEEEPLFDVIKIVSIDPETYSEAEDKENNKERREKK